MIPILTRVMVWPCVCFCRMHV